VKDEKGEDMHKSAGNAIWFEDAAEKMGVDVMRWVYISHNPFNNLNFGYHIADETRKRLITLWNSYSFFATYAALDNYLPEKHNVKKEDLSELDLWLLARLNLLVKDVINEYSNYSAAKAMKYVDSFLEDLSNWYIRRSRRRFWKSEDDSDKWAAYQTLYSALKGLILMLAPVIPFVTDKIYQNLVRELETDAPESIHLYKFPIVDESYIDRDLIDRIDLVIKIVGLGRAARNKANLKVRQPLSRLLVKLSEKDSSEVLEKLSDQLKEELNIKSIEIIESDSEVADYIIKPNFAILREKYLKYMGEIPKKVNALDPVSVAEKLNVGGTIEMELSDQIIFLAAEDLLVECKDKEGFSVVTDADYTVAVDTQLNDELLREGLIRDFIRQIQTLRKEADFKVEDRIKVSLDFDANLQEAYDCHKDYFKTETLTNIMEEKFTPGEFNKDIKIRGMKIPVSISRI